MFTLIVSFRRFYRMEDNKSAEDIAVDTDALIQSSGGARPALVPISVSLIPITYLLRQSPLVGWSGITHHSDGPAVTNQPAGRATPDVVSRSANLTRYLPRIAATYLLRSLFLRRKVRTIRIRLAFRDIGLAVMFGRKFLVSARIHNHVAAVSYALRDRFIHALIMLIRLCMF